MAQPLLEIDKGKIRTTESDIAEANEMIEKWKRISNALGIQLKSYKTQALVNINLSPASHKITSDLKVAKI